MDSDAGEWSTGDTVNDGSNTNIRKNVSCDRTRDWNVNKETFHLVAKPVAAAATGGSKQ